MFAASRCFYTEGCCSTATILVVADERGAEDSLITLATGYRTKVASSNPCVCKTISLPELTLTKYSTYKNRNHIRTAVRHQGTNFP